MFFGERGLHAGNLYVYAFPKGTELTLVQE
jgi:hypothetical protein